MCTMHTFDFCCKSLCTDSSILYRFFFFCFKFFPLLFCSCYLLLYTFNLLCVCYSLRCRIVMLLLHFIVSCALSCFRQLAPGIMLHTENHLHRCSLRNGVFFSLFLLHFLVVVVVVVIHLCVMRVFGNTCICNNKRHHIYE